MRFTIQLLCLVGALTATIGSPLPGEPILDLEAIAKMTPQELDDLAGGLAAEELIRTKRSGSGDILGTVTKTISSGLSSKLGYIASASAGASSLLTSGSSKGHNEHSEHGYTYSAPSHTKSFDFWTLKKSILNTLFQAVKAITGGVTILNGQLIKGGGALASGVGKLISIKGDAVTNFGRHIVSSATLVPPKKKHVPVAPAPIVHHHVSAPAHISGPGPIHPSGPALPVSSYGPPTAPAHFSAPSGPSAHFPSSGGHFAPSTAPSHLYGPSINHNSLLGGLPSKYTHPYEGRGKPMGVQAGFIVLQPLDSGLHGTNSDAHSASSGQPSFISSALQALKGIIGGNSESAHTDHGSQTASAPSAPAHNDIKDSIFHPPPPVSGSGSSYNSYSLQSDIPSFKPLDIPTGHDEKPSGLVSSYGTPVTYDTGLSNSVNVQSMVDHVAESQLNNLGYGQKNPSFNAYLDSFSDSQGGYSQKNEDELKIPGPLNLVELNKITKNANKVQQRSDMVAESSNRKSNVETIKEIARTMALNELIENFEKLTTTTTTTTTTSPPIIVAEKPTPKSQLRNSVNVQKSVSYELRGNRVVRLTDSIGDA